MTEHSQGIIFQRKIKILLVQVRLRTEVPSTPSSCNKHPYHPIVMGATGKIELQGAKVYYNINTLMHHLS